jgi:hypothetical protein
VVSGARPCHRPRTVTNHERCTLLTSGCSSTNRNMSDASPKHSCATLAHNCLQQDEAEDDTDMTPADESDTMTCPLFMEGLPSDFSTNPALAALASLVEEEDVKGPQSSVSSLESSHTICTAGGGKVCRIKSLKASKSAPYPKQRPTVINQPKKKATVAEASLFLKMWKI